MYVHVDDAPTKLMDDMWYTELNLDILNILEKS